MVRTCSPRIVQCGEAEVALAISAFARNWHGAVGLAHNSLDLLVVSSASLASAWTDVVEGGEATRAIIVTRTYTATSVVPALRRAIKNVRTLAEACLHFRLIKNETNWPTKTNRRAMPVVCLQDYFVIVQSTRHPTISKAIVAFGAHFRSTE